MHGEGVDDQDVDREQRDRQEEITPSWSTWFTRMGSAFELARIAGQRDARDRPMSLVRASLPRARSDRSQVRPSGVASSATSMTK